MFARTVMIEDLGVELCCGMYATIRGQSGFGRLDILFGCGSRDIGVDDLGHGGDALIRHEVEDHRLDIGASHGLPFQIFFGQLGVLRRLTGDRLNGTWAIFGLLCPSDICQSVV